MDYLQDSLIAFEDEKIQGHSYAVAWNNKENSECGIQSGYCDDDDKEIQWEWKILMVSIPVVMVNWNAAHTYK